MIQLMENDKHMLCAKTWWAAYRSGILRHNRRHTQVTQKL